jgi:exonuclease SbcC
MTARTRSNALACSFHVDSHSTSVIDECTGRSLIIPSIVRKVIDILKEVNWKQVDRAITITYEDVCGIEDFYQFWEFHQQEEVAAKLPSPANSSTIRLFAEELRRESDLERVTQPSVRVIDKIEQSLSNELDLIAEEIPRLEADSTDVQRSEKHHREKRETLEAGLQILDEYWPEKGRDLPVNVGGDRRVIQTTLEEIEEEPASLELSANLEEEIDDIEQEITQLDREIQRCENGIDRLKAAFERDGGEAELETFVQDHMTVISTFFIAFQRPYEFEAVTLQEDGSLVVKEKDDGDEVSPDSLSSGQRAALALAIFITNNLAHETAPPLMLLDEPFAYLDDVNTVSFFNLLIELATREERQIIFATANQDIADLLERKAGNSDHFNREKLPRKEAGLES